MSQPPDNFEYDILPAPAMPRLHLAELWQCRELLWVLAWRDLAIRYKQTILGVSWAVIRPTLSALVFVAIFNRLVNVSSGDGTPYLLFVYIGILFWQYYADVVTGASASMLQNAQMLQKVYFPKLVIPTTVGVTAGADAAIGGLILIGLLVFYGYAPSLHAIYVLPLVLLVLLLSSLGAGLFLAALNVKYRDVRHALPFLIEIAKYLTPVAYPMALLDAHPRVKWAMLILNPLSGAISEARKVLTAVAPVDWQVMATILLSSSVLFLLGLLYFRRTERYIADVI